ncbi:MAG: hypothetical protein U1D35_09920 [Paracoccaceae bacterium]|nr:hypothetical protein [Paracoccaceae bacterium]
MPIIPPIWRVRPTTPEQHLASAILAQAFTDMFGGAVNQSETRDTVDTIAITAMRYLTDHHGQSAQWRNKWCDFLDLDGDVLATRVRMILDGKIDPPGDERFANRLAIARDRWLRISQRPSPSDKPKRLPTIKPEPPPKPDPRRLVLDSLREGPKTIREIVFAVNGAIDSSTARVHLMRAVAEGIVEHDIPFWSLRKIAA